LAADRTVGLKKSHDSFVADLVIGMHDSENRDLQVKELQKICYKFVNSAVLA